MSIDEIRTEKALALLDFTEASEQVQRLRADRAIFVKQLRNFAAVLEDPPPGTLGTLEANHAHLSAVAARRILSALDAAERRLTAAAARKAHLGI